MKKVLVFFLFVVFCFIGRANSAKAMKEPQTLGTVDSTNWCWLSVARGLVSQITDNVPTQTNLFLERIKTGGLSEINDANGKGSPQDLEIAINNFLTDHRVMPNASEAAVVAKSSDLFAAGNLEEKMALVRSLCDAYGAVGVLKGDHWLLVVRIYDQGDGCKVEYMDADGHGIVVSDYKDFFSKTLSNGVTTSAISSYCYLKTPQLQSFKIQPLESPTFGAKNLWAKKISVYNINGVKVCSIAPGVEYDVYRSDAYAENNTVKHFLTPGYSEFYVKGEDCAPLDASGQRLELLTNKSGKEVELLNAETGNVIQKLDSSDPAQITIRGYEAGRFLTDLYGNCGIKCYIKSEDIGNFDEFLFLLNRGTFTRSFRSAYSYTVSVSSGACICSSCSPDKTIIRISRDKTINVFNAIHGILFVTGDNFYYVSKDYVEINL